MGFRIFLSAALLAAAAQTPEDMVLVPAGTFYRGSHMDEGFENERPRREIYLDAFYMDKYEVTAKLYRPFAEKAGITMRRQPFADETNHPVVYVSWEDAKAYCESVLKRLPTEAEWEKAARAGSDGPFAFGKSEVLLDDYAWHTANGDKRLHPVGEKKPNAYGLYDMHGNVLEWTADYYDPDYYKDSPGKNPAGPAKGQYRVVRGGSVYLSPKLLRSAQRMKGKQTTRYSARGLRCAKDAAATP